MEIVIFLVSLFYFCKFQCFFSKWGDNRVFVFSIRAETKFLVKYLKLGLCMESFFIYIRVMERMVEKVDVEMVKQYRVRFIRESLRLSVVGRFGVDFLGQESRTLTIVSKFSRGEILVAVILGLSGIIKGNNLSIKIKWVR